MKSVLVTGATGLIGSRLVTALAERGDNVTALSRSQEKLDKLFGNVPNVKTIAADVCKAFALDCYDLIFHAASPVSGAVINSSPLDVIRPNVMALQSIFDRMVTCDSKARIVIFSSATVYGSASNTDKIVTESDTMSADCLDNAQAMYSESKRMAEVLTRAYVRQYGIDAVIVRPSWVYGETMFPPNTAMYSFIETARCNQNIVLNKSGTAGRDNIHVDDVVSGLLIVSENGRTGEAYNISSKGEGGNFAAIDEIAKIIAEISNEEYKTNIVVQHKEHQPERRGAGIILDNVKLCELSPATVQHKLMPLRAGIRKTILGMSNQL